MRRFPLLVWAVMFLFFLPVPVWGQHPDDPEKEQEHHALLALVPPEQATHVARRSGSWSERGTWNRRRVPQAGSRILIPPGIRVLFDAYDARGYQWIRVQGELAFATDRSTFLVADTIVVDPGAKYFHRVPHPYHSTVLFQGPSLHRMRDPLAIGRGLISHGTARIEGGHVTAYETIAIPAQAGDTTLTLSTAPVGWKTGGRILLPPVNPADPPETARIADLAGNTVTLATPLKRHHTTPTQEFGDRISIPACYMERNIRYRSQSSALDRRGHVMFMHSGDVQVSDAAFETLGRTDAFRPVTDPEPGNPVIGDNPRGRYALHFHRAGAGSAPVMVSRVIVLDSPKLGIVNHDSRVVVEDSVAVDCDGSGFFTEEGTEVGAFRRNVAVSCVGPGGELDSRFNPVPGRRLGSDMGFGGHGFWLQGGGVEVVDNLAFGCSSSGITFLTQPLLGPGRSDRRQFPAALLEDPSSAGGRAAVEVWEVPVRRFAGNRAMACLRGLEVVRHGPTVGRRSRFEDFIGSRLTFMGLNVEYGGGFDLRGLSLSGEGYGTYGNAIVHTVAMEDVEIRGFLQGLWVPANGDVSVIGARLIDNLHQIMSWSRTDALPGYARRVLEGVTFERTPGRPVPVVIEANGARRAAADIVVRNITPPGLAGEDSLRVNGVLLSYPQQFNTYGYY